MEKKDVWSTSDILANRNNWSLAADVELLKHLQALSEKIFTKATSTLHSLNSFENDINQTCISIANTSNKFKSLSDTQFIESKVQEESSDMNEPSSSQNEPPADRGNENITVKLKEALENGFQVLDTQYDIIPVSGSDSEDDEPQEILLRARNPYLSRRLPHIIGSEEFTRNDNLGLIDSSSSEEDEEEEEEDEDDDDTDDNEEERKKVHIDSDEESIIVRKPPSPKSEFIRPRTEIIRISSSDSEDSESSIPYDRSNKQEKINSESKNKPTEKSKDNEPVQNSNSFAEHLNAALKNNPRDIYSTVPPDFGDTFSPPPFPGKNNDISSDDDSEDSSDIFATKKSTKHSISNTKYKSNYDNESDDEDDWRAKEIGVISQEPVAKEKSLESSRKSSIVGKTSQHSDTSSSSSNDNEAYKKDSTVMPPPTSQFAQSNVNSINKKMASAINAELNAKLNLKGPCIKPTENLTSAKASTKSSETHTPVETSAKSSKNNTPAKTSKPKTSSEPMPSTNTKKDSNNSALFDKLDDKSNSKNDVEDDLFSGMSVAKRTTSKGKKSKGLFDDDDNIDGLFSPVKSATSSTKKSDDLFSSKPSESIKPDETANKSTVQPPVVDLFKNSNLFASDSDSEDDIFSIIKSQKKPATDIFKTKPDSLFENDSSNSEKTSIPSNNAQSIKTPIFDPIIKSAPSKIESSSLTEEKLPSCDVKTSIKVADSTKLSINEKNDGMVASSSKNNILEDVKKTTEDLFQSDDDDDNDLFEKNIRPGDKRTSAHKNVDVSKSADLFADNSEAKMTKTGILSSTDINENAREQSAPEILKNIHPSTSSESISDAENPTLQNKKNITESDKKSNIFARIQPPKLSSSSEDEDVKRENTFVTVSDTSRKDENKKTDVLSQKDDIFGEYSKSSTSNKDSKSDDDIFGESYGSRSAMFLPPKDDSSDGFSEDEDIKDSNYLSQEDEDLFDEKFEPPPFQKAIPDNDDMFSERGFTNVSQESPKKSINDTTPAEDLFAKSISSLPSADLFSNNNDDLKENENLFDKTSHEKSREKLNLNLDSENRIEKDEELNKNDSVQKPLISNEEKLDSAQDIVFSSEPKESGLFNFSEKELFDSDSDEFSVVSDKNVTPALVPDNITKSKEIEQITPPEKASQDQIKKSDEKLQDDNVNKKISPSPKIGKISTSVFEKPNTEKRQDEDVQDGNVFAKSSSPEAVSSSRSAPGKLSMGRGLNINVNALLPGGNWSSKMKQKQSTEQVTSDEKQDIEPTTPNESKDTSEKSTGLLNNVIKERPKVLGKRRPPSRQARKSRILTDDVFGTGLETEAPQEENKLNVPFGSPKLREIVKVEKSEKLEKPVEAPKEENKSNIPFGLSKLHEKAEVEKSKRLKKTVDDLFDDDEDKIDDLFGISRSKVDKQSDAISKPQVSNVPSSREESDGDLDLDINSSLNRLPNLTKGRAKPQKRSSPPKKTSDIPPVIPDENITPSDPASKPIAEKSDVFVDENLIPVNPSKPTLPSTKTPVAKSIFDSLEDDSDNLFESVKSKKIIEKNSAAKVKVVEPKLASKPSQQPATIKPVPVKNVKKIDIFNDDDDDELFTSAKKKLSTNKLSKKNSLFEDNDDDDLFGTKTAVSSSRKTLDPVASSTKTKVLNEKPRVVKLRSETVQKDPLTGKDLTGPL